MAILTASPNPAGTWGAIPTTTNISWNTQIAAAGKVFVSINGAAETLVPGQAAAGARTGTNLPLELTSPNTYALTLRRADNNNALATALVTTYDVRDQLIDGFAETYLPQLRPQAITHLVVKPGVDTVRISFRTIRPTIPLVTLFDESGAKVDARFPLFGGMQTSHQAVFGVERPLAQENRHKFTIVAAGPTANKNNPKETVLSGEFVTGSRKADIFFDKVDVHDDGDPWPRGAGEFTFTFGAGDADTHAAMGEPWPRWGEGNISDDDPPVDIKQQITIPHAPPRIWVQVVATENDSTIMPWEAGFGFGTRPTFEEEGSKFSGSEVAQQATVTRLFDLGDEPGVSMTPFEMRTGDFDVDYVMNCRLALDIKLGSFISPKMKYASPIGKVVAWLFDPAHIAALSSSRGSGQAALIALGPDGAFYHRASGTAPQGSKDGEWARIELPAQGAVAAAALADGRLELFLLGEDGDVMHRSYDAQKPSREKWRKLGGRFRHILPAVERPNDADASVVLFGLAEDGTTHVRDSWENSGDWQRLGDQPLRAVAPASIPGRGIALLGVADDGTLHHFTRRKGRWVAATAEPRIPGRVATQLLTAVATDGPTGKGRGQDVLIGAMGEDYSVRMLHWPDFPRGSPMAWKELGPLQELITARGAAEPTAARTPPRKKAATKASATRSLEPAV